MKRLVVSPDALASGHATLTGRLHRHVVRVLRLREGAELLLTDGKGHEYEGTIAQVDEHAVHVTLRRERPGVAEPTPRLTLIFGLARGGRSEFVIQKTTELGVTRLVPALCARSTARPSDVARKHLRWTEIARQAARQCGRAHLPAVEPAAALAEALGVETSASALRLVAAPEAPPLSRIETELRADREEVVMVVGPEGGLDEAELALCEKAGFLPVGLGPLTLRTETAPLVLVSLVAYLSGRWERAVR